MFETDFKLKWDFYQNNLSKGFSELQQKQEFVDVTLAAEGHLVGAHQNIIALASPYLKEMLHSAPCKHPVIFFNDINHKTLAYILKYVYTGEVQVPSIDFQSFIKAAKTMHIVGIENVVEPQTFQQINQTNSIIPSEVKSKIHDSNTESCREKEYVAHITFSNNECIAVQSSVQNTNSNYNENAMDVTDYDTTNIINLKENQAENCKKYEATTDFEEVIDENTAKQPPVISIEINSVPENPSNTSHSDETMLNEIPTIDSHTHSKTDITLDSSNLKDNLARPLYTMSNRGCLQMLFNRHIYYMHHISRCGRKRRWRCLEYRRQKCKAFIDTNGELVISRQNKHCHSFHDSKIFSLARKKNVFTSIERATGKAAIMTQEYDD